MASYGSYSNAQRPSEPPNMLQQGTVVEGPHAGPQSETVGEGVGSQPNIYMEVRVKKEKTGDENLGGCHVSSPKLFNEVQTMKDNRPLLPEETSLPDIKKERKDAQSPSRSEGKTSTGEAGGAENKSLQMKESAERKKTDISRDEEKTHESSSPNERKNSKQANKKRKLIELYAEELSLRNDLRRINPTSHDQDRSFEVPRWVHHATEGERNMPQSSENIGYAQYINKAHADPKFKFERMGIHDMPPEYHFVDGTRANDQIHKNAAYLPSIDPRNRKFFIREEPRTDQTPYRPVQEELLSRAWHPKYEVLFANPASSEYHSKNDLKTSKQSKEEAGLQSKERFERHYRLQGDSYQWPYPFDPSAVLGDGYEKKRLAFLRVEHPEERHNQSKPYQVISPERRPDSRPSMAEYVQYLPASKMLIPAPKPDFLLNGVSGNVPYELGHPFSPVTDKGSLAFIDKGKVFYPCCNEEIPTLHYDNMASKARWFDSRNDRQRFDAFQALKPRVPYSGPGNQPHAMFLDDRARLIRVDGPGCHQNSSLQTRERFKDNVPLPNYASGMPHELSNRQFRSEETIAADRHARRIDAETIRKGGQPPAAYESRAIKETLENNARGATTESNTKMVKDGENKQIGVNQAGEEGTKGHQDPKNSETQPQLDGENLDVPGSKKPISCSVCKKTFNRTSNLYTHMRTHSANKPHACEFCGKRFHQKADLRIHRYIHTGEKPHKCTKCGRGFKQLTHLKYHMRTHSDVRMYKCPYCEKGFNQKSNLQAHIFGHTGQRPHKCETCGKGFTLASTLNTHKRTHLPNKPFKCEFCDRAFYQKNALKMHYVSTHPYSSGVCLV